MRAWAWLVLVSGTFVPLTATGQVPLPGASPEEVAELVLAADSTRDWRSLLQLAHPDALLEFRETQLKMLEPVPGPLGVVDSCMRRVFQSAGFARQRETHLRYALDSIFHVPTIDSLGHLSPDSVFARYGQHLSHLPMPRPLDPRAPTRKILGALYGPSQTAYVLVYEYYDSLPGPTWPRERTETTMDPFQWWADCATWSRGL